LAAASSFRSLALLCWLAILSSLPWMRLRRFRAPVIGPSQSLKEVTMDDMEIVAALLANLADKVGQERLDLWLGSQSRLTLDGDALLVELPTRFAQDWVRSHFRREMETAGAEVLGQPVKLEFRVNEGLAKARQTARHESQRDSANGEVRDGACGGTSTAIAAPSGDNRKPLLNHLPAATPSTGRSQTSDELLGLRRQFAALDSFVVGQSNQFAHAAAQTAVEQPGRYSPLLIHGPTGVGKTHLLEGIWTSAHRRNPRIKAVYLTAEQFTTHYVEALKAKVLPMFRQKHRGVDLLLIDDVQFLAGKTATIGELLVTADALIRKGSQLVLTADRAPTALRDLNEQFIARLAAGMACEIDRPEFQTRLGILRQFAARIGLELTDDVAEFIATHLTSHARELSGALNRLDAASRIWRQPITRALAEESLVDLIRHNAPAVRLADIDKAVCTFFGLQPETLQSNRRAKTVSQPRMLAMWLARKHTSAALTEIGQHFGRRSHSTVISAQKAVAGLVARQGKIELSGKTWSVEEAIRRVEEQLRTA
jgi:chromosomal replication initiator protein